MNDEPAMEEAADIEKLETPTQPRQGILDQSKGVWWVTYRDHAGRIIRFRIGERLSERIAKIGAFEHVERYEADVDIRERVRYMLGDDEILEMAERAPFPREVVARFILQICQRLAKESRSDIEDRQKSTPGIFLFAERLNASATERRKRTVVPHFTKWIDPENPKKFRREPVEGWQEVPDEARKKSFINKMSGVSVREARRILEDEDRITVSIDTVDKICNEFNINISDVVQSALDWSRLVGEWAGRMGGVDPWPYGYATREELEESDL